MTKTDFIFTFAQRALWLYMVEAVVVLAIGMVIARVHN